ncbi:MAG: helix-turn-helix domain-containing protein [Actinophytocola sp.]|uniref:helix-turn-helix domain-containing protein n=1 Tax=Actinophytocola sp. TaxID=1872138 RepID=UPI00132295CD|nr:helix-turn-helix transcriptional regulator [Actinophytocola sp.]MPZ80622.1 helix-turn-helix domain-containing protein [Actinophytocola sp.]
MAGKSKSVSSNRREVGAALRSFRKRAGVERVEDAAEFIDVSAVTIGRIEKGEAPISRANLGVLAEKYGLDDHERDALMELARQTRGKRGTFPAYFSVKTRALLELESEASDLLIVTIDLIPAHFQTERYTQALFEGTGESLPQEEIDKLKRIRLDRQAILTQPKPPKVRAIVHETALRMPIGGTEVMHEQLLHLAELAGLPNVEIQVQPASAGMYPGIGTTFTLMRLDNDPTTDRVQIDSPGDSVYRDRISNTEPYRLSWERKRVAALSLPASRSLILDVAGGFAPGTGR